MGILARELRIGNLVWDDYSGEMIISQITHSTESVNFRKTWQLPDGWALCKDIKPIPLTEEWLLKFGFTYRIDTGFNGWYSTPILGESIRIYKIEQGWFKYHSSLTVIKYVHKLQNLYFALTGEELIIKTP